MKKATSLRKRLLQVIVCLTATTVAACGAPKAGETATLQSAPTFPDGKPIVGFYNLTNPAGVTSQVEIRSDGTVVFETPSGQRFGQWRIDENGSYCSGPKDGPETCYIEEISEDGIWTSAPIASPEQKSIIVRIKD